MARPHVLLDWIALDGNSAVPRYRQLYLELRTAIASGRLPAGSLLPSSRTLACELGVSRNTVVNAYEQLAAEGFVETSEASGTLVSNLPVERGEPMPINGAPAAAGPAPLNAHRWNSALSIGLDHLPQAVAFAPGIPAFDEFPVKTWARLLAQHSHRMQPDMADNDDHVGGYGPLREALADGPGGGSRLQLGKTGDAGCGSHHSADSRR